MSAADAGRSADRRGQEWQRHVAAAARPWFPAADHVGRFHPAGQGDITGIGDRILECTVQPLENLAAKLRQAESDAIRSDFGEYYVVKKAVREPAGRAYVVTRLDVLLPLLARYDRMDGDLADAAGLVQDLREA